MWSRKTWDEEGGENGGGKKLAGEGVLAGQGGVNSPKRKAAPECRTHKQLTCLILQYILQRE